MTAYLINHLRIPGGVPKPDALTYLEQVEVLEGAWPGSVVLMEFPDLDTAKKWYDSPEYQEILGLRTDNTTCDVVLVEPVGPEFTSANWARQIRAVVNAGSAAES
jgi:uncharacterized protein DUF1330